MKIHFTKTNSILDKICETKILEIGKTSKVYKSTNLKNPKKSFFRDAISKKNRISLIAEVKKASPSEGVIRKDFNPVEIAKIYEKSGANAISVLTDSEFFQGSNKYLKEIVSNVDLPVLRKEFIIHESQIVESVEIGANAILLIAKILSDTQLKDFYQMASQLGLDVLVETSDENEIERVLDLNPEIVGINNRNLTDFKVDLKNFEKLSKYIPSNVIKVAESGIRTKEDVEYLKQNGANAVLVGTLFMMKEDIGEAVRGLVGS